MNWKRKIIDITNHESLIVAYWTDFQLVILLLDPQVVIVFCNYFLLYPLFLLLICRLVYHLHVEHWWSSELLQLWYHNLVWWPSFKLWPSLLWKSSIFHLLLNRLRQLSIDLSQSIVDHVYKPFSYWCHLVSLDLHTLWLK